MTGPLRLGDVVAVLESLYDPRWAADWDAVGLVTGDPDQPVRRVLLAVDPVQAVVEEAVDWAADLLVTHHPLLLRGVHSVATTGAKGRAVTSLVRAGVALHVAHTNADAASPGVSDALAAVLGLADVRPLRPAPRDPLDALVTFVPEADAERVLDALAAAGAGRLGDYERCAFTSGGTGTFTSLPGAAPAVGGVGHRATVTETRIEMVLARHRRSAVLAALRAAHPYEEPAFDLVELAEIPGPRGLGRLGAWPAGGSLRDLAAHVAAVLPATPHGVRVGGDLDRPVHTVAVCGGAGDDMFDDVRSAGADAYVTADLRHHPASEALEQGCPGLVDVSHWASEWPWLADCAQLLGERLRAAHPAADTVETRVSRLVTDPWVEAITGAGPTTTTARSPH
ncbi:MAG: Nif3-like dinuclear metal center hexameric protein [Sporichthyaceae bacterium]